MPAKPQKLSPIGQPRYSFLSPIRKFFPSNKIVAIGNPVRTELLNGSLDKAKEIFGLSDKNQLFLSGAALKGQRDKRTGAPDFRRTLGTI